MTCTQKNDSKDNEFFFYNDESYKENHLGQMLKDVFLIENLADNHLKKDQAFHIAKEIDKRSNHCVFFYKDFDRSLKKSNRSQGTEKNVIEELFRRHKEILDNLTEISLSPEKSDFSIIITCIKKIDTPIINPEETIDRRSIKIELKEIEEDDVKQALVSLLEKSLKNESSRFDIVIENFWRITRGLPGAIHQLLVDIENDEDLIYELHRLDLSNHELPHMVDNFYKRLVDENFITSKCFAENDNGLTKAQKEKLISEICTYRTINNRIFKECITRVNKELKTTQINMNNMRDLLENVCFIKSNLYDFEIYPSIRHILFNYYKKTKKEKIDSHEKAKNHFFTLWIKKVSSMEDEDDLHRELFLIEEAIWHETNIAIFSSKTKKQLLDNIRLLIEKSYQENPEFKETIRSELSFLYKRGDEEKHKELRNEFKMYFDSESENFKTFPMQVIS